MRICIFSNPNGRRVKRYLGRLVTELPHLDGLEHLVTTDETDLAKLVSERVWTAEDLVVINGGDGTAQRVLTAFLKQDMDILPGFALLPGGTTNMTANCYNHSRSYKKALGSLRRSITTNDSRELVARYLVEVSSSNGTIYGAFFGAGLIVQGIQFCHDYVYKTGMRSEIGAGIALVRAAWGIARKQAPFSNPSVIRVDEYPELPMLIFMVSSLDKLFLGMRPFWGKENGALHLTGIMQGAVRFLRRLPRIMKGGDKAATLSSAQGYESRNTDRVNLDFDGPFTIDGELFETSGLPVTLSSSRVIGVLGL